MIAPYYMTFVDLKVNLNFIKIFSIIYIENNKGVNKVFIDKYGHNFKDIDEITDYAYRLFYTNKTEFIKEILNYYSKEELADKLFNCYHNLDNIVDKIEFHSMMQKAENDFIKQYIENCKKNA